MRRKLPQVAVLVLVLLGSTLAGCSLTPIQMPNNPDSQGAARRDVGLPSPAADASRRADCPECKGLWNEGSAGERDHGRGDLRADRITGEGWAITVDGGRELGVPGDGMTKRDGQPASGDATGKKKDWP